MFSLISHAFFPISDVNETRIKTISLEPIDQSQMENWLFAIESTRHTLILPMTLAIDFANLTSQKLDFLSDTSILQFYQLLYKRIVKFTSYIGVFSSLSQNDRKVCTNFLYFYSFFHHLNLFFHHITHFTTFVENVYS